MATSDNKTADTDEKIFIGKGEQAAWLTLALANRHGLVTGATGTGKTVTLQVMAEGFARAGVYVRRQARVGFVVRLIDNPGDVAFTHLAHTALLRPRPGIEPGAGCGDGVFPARQRL